MTSRPFLVLYLSVFVAVLGISMVTPLLPVYAKELGATGVWIGLTFSIFAVTQAVTSPFVGRLSDVFGRKTFIVAGLVVYFAGAIGYLTAASFYQVLGFRALSGLGTSLIFSCARAYVGDMAPRGQEGRWLGVYATADIVGFGVGPILAGVLREATGFDSVFVSMAGLMATAAVIVALFLPATPPMARRPAPDASRPAPGLGAAVRDRLVLALTLNLALISLSMGATMSFLAVKIEDGLGAAPLVIGAAFAVQNLASGVAQPVVGALADRRNRRVLIAVGLSWAAAMLVSLGLVHQIGLVFLVLVGMGAGSALSQVTGGAMQVVAGRRVGMGSVLGLTSAGNGVGTICGSVLGGLLVDRFGIDSAFFFGACGMLAGIPVFVFLTRDTETSERVVIDAASGPVRPVP